MGLFVTATDAYWTVLSGSVRSCPLSGCAAAVTTLMQGIDEPLKVTVHDSDVYVTDRGGGQVVTCPSSGCTSPTVLATGEGGPLGIVADQDALY